MQSEMDMHIIGKLRARIAELEAKLTPPEPPTMTAPMMPPTHPQFSNPGWTCPRCGRGNAPSTATCPCVPPPPLTVTC